MPLYLQPNWKLELFKFDELFTKTLVNKHHGKRNVATQNLKTKANSSSKHPERKKINDASENE